ncbi:male sterility protein-domain-containing protein [Tricladium varicosporioides]|nr:male sterility protein-domain-containing protein [Hymenoscyphus varicosporioides]
MAVSEGPKDLTYLSFFKDQTVFLTGATGGLGGCLLHKLINELPTKKIFVLVRSIEKAEKTWKDILPGFSIIACARITLIVGDITKENFGISASQLADLAKETTIVINAAANTSFTMALPEAITDNCLSALHLAQISTNFLNLKHFIHISTAYANSHLPDQKILEKIYPLGDAEAELADILDPTKQTTEYAHLFPWAYGYTKHITERLLFKRYPNLPILIIRPTSIGSAVSSPYPLYGPPKATPMEQAFRLFHLNTGSGIVHTAKGHSTGCNIFDEVPFDWVCNLILLHTSASTRGIVHAGSESYIPCTLDQLVTALLSPEDCSNGKGVVWVKDRSVEQSRWPAFYKVLNKDWRFSNERSKMFRGLKGPLSISVEGHDQKAYDSARREKILVDVRAKRKAKKSKL